MAVELEGWEVGSFAVFCGGHEAIFVGGDAASSNIMTRYLVLFLLDLVKTNTINYLIRLMIKLTKVD